MDKWATLPARGGCPLEKSTCRLCQLPGSQITPNFSIGYRLQVNAGMKKAFRLLFLGSLATALAVIFVAGCSSKNEARREIGSRDAAPGNSTLEPAGGASLKLQGGNFVCERNGYGDHGNA
jgi:hypothetical protein